MALKNIKLIDEEFFSERKEIMAKYPGGEIDLDEAIEYQKKIAPERNAVSRILEAEKSGDILVESRGGYATFEEMAELFRVLSEAGCDILPITIDTYTRTCLFEKAAMALEESKRVGRSLINGWPIVAHGVETTRRLMELTEHPALLRAVGCDERLQWEIALASGLSGGPGDAVNYFASGSKRDSFEKCLRDYQYVHRLIGYYESRGVPIYREFHGCNVGVIIPPSLFDAYAVVEILLAAEQGVKHICPIYPTNGSLIQDMAGNKALMELGREYLQRFGHKDVWLCQGVNQWRGEFPREEGKAFAVICQGAATAALGGSRIVINKTTHEGYGVPTVESHRTGVQATKLIVSLLKDHAYPETPELIEEKEQIKKETRAIVDHILDLGDGDLNTGLLEGVKTGAWDAPFTSNIQLRDAIMPVRDVNGAIRYLDSGNFPFTKEIIDWNRAKIEERIRRKGGESDYRLVIEDVVSGIEYNLPKSFQVGEISQFKIREKSKKADMSKTIITGVIGIEDPHIVGTKLLSSALREEGFKVVGLGAKCIQEEFIKAAIETDADAILLSSIAGMGELNCRGFREMCEEAGIGGILIYLGGTIVIGKQPWEEVEQEFKKMGINRVYPPDHTSIAKAIRDLRNDLQLV